MAHVAVETLLRARGVISYQDIINTGVNFMESVKTLYDLSIPINGRFVARGGNSRSRVIRDLILFFYAGLIVESEDGKLVVA